MAWTSIYAIAREANEYKKFYESHTPLACPNDGEPLSQGPNGVRFCKFDGWRWNGTWDGDSHPY